MSFFGRWKQGILSTTPVQQLVAKRLALSGQVLGILFAAGVLFYKGQWYWLPFLTFTMLLLSVELLAVVQQLRQLKKLGGD